MKDKRRSTGEEKGQKIAAGEEGNYRMERVPLKQTDRHHKSPGGDLCIRDSLIGGRIHYAYILSDIVKVFYIITKLATINKILTLAGNINLIYKNILR